MRMLNLARSDCMAKLLAESKHVSVCDTLTQSTHHVALLIPMLTSTTAPAEIVNLYNGYMQSHPQPSGGLWAQNRTAELPPTISNYSANASLNCCGVCLHSTINDTTITTFSEVKSGTNDYLLPLPAAYVGGQVYHIECANFWLHKVDHVLPVI